MPLLASDSPVKSKRRRLAADLHRNFTAPLSFLKEATTTDSSTYFVDEGKAGTLFGKNREAFVRSDYVELYKIMNQKIIQKFDDEEQFDRGMLLVLQGSSGVGKSTFLAYLIAKLMSKDRTNRLDNIAIFRAPKGSKASTGQVNLSSVTYYILNDGNASEGEYSPATTASLREEVKNMEVIIMDGCSMQFDLDQFGGVVIVAASPSQYTKNLRDAFPVQHFLLMPPLELSEALEMGRMLNADKEVIRNNFQYTGGITRYLFQAGYAKRQVDVAIQSMNSRVISRMVSSQSISKGENQVTAHSLVLWSASQNDQGKEYEGTPIFSLVSRYVERSVSDRLVKESLEQLRESFKDMAPLSGAEGYAGSLFEAYAIRKLQAGGTFSMRRLCQGHTAQKRTLVIPKLVNDPIVVETNNSSEDSVSFDSLRETDESGGQVPCILWPTTTNFPTFDCFFIDGEGTPLPMQMTISKKHVLKHSGAQNVLEYFNKFLGERKPDKYCALFVVPEDMASSYEEQPFTGPIKPSKGRGEITSEDMAGNFEQWVMGL